MGSSAGLTVAIQNEETMASGSTIRVATQRTTARPIRLALSHALARA